MIHFYFDEHLHRPAANGLIERGGEVTMAVDIYMEGNFPGLACPADIGYTQDVRT